MSFNSQNYQFSIGEHHSKNVVLVHFPYNLLWKDELKEKFPSAKWSASKNCWYLPDTSSIRNEIGMIPKTEMGKTVISKSDIVKLFAQVENAYAQIVLRHGLARERNCKSESYQHLGNVKSPLDDL